MLAGRAGERGVGCEHVPDPLRGQDRGQGEQDQGTHQVPLPEPMYLRYWGGGGGVKRESCHL